MGSRQRHTIDLDIERREPFRHADEDARRRIVRKIARIYSIDGREVLGRRAVDAALHHIQQRRPRRLQAIFQLLQDQLGLPLDRAGEEFTGIGIEWRQARNEHMPPPRVTVETGAFRLASQDNIGSTWMISRSLLPPL
jgi:hypothetical protein